MSQEDTQVVQGRDVRYVLAAGRQGIVRRRAMSWAAGGRSKVGFLGVCGNRLTLVYKNDDLGASVRLGMATGTAQRYILDDVK